MKLTSSILIILLIPCQLLAQNEQFNPSLVRGLGIYYYDTLQADYVQAELFDRIYNGNLVKISEEKSLEFAWSVDREKPVLTLEGQMNYPAEMNVTFDEACRYQKGSFAYHKGKNYLIIGAGIQQAQVLQKMAQVLDREEPELPKRILLALEEGLQEDGFLYSPRFGNLVFSGFSLVVMDSSKPLEELRRLLRQKTGRTRLDKALALQKENNIKEAQRFLKEALDLLADAPAEYRPLIDACLLLDMEKEALASIQKALNQDQKWENHLPRYYPLIRYPQYQEWIDEAAFSQVDWFTAIRSYLHLERPDDAIFLINRLIKDYEDDHYSYYLMGLAYQQKKSRKLARKSYRRSLVLKPDFQAAQLALDRLP